MRQWSHSGFLALAAVAILALVIRVPMLKLRPMHHDEANQAVKCGVLLETGVYEYDPGDHHGPSLYYLTLPFARLAAGRNFAATSEFTFRIVPVFFGAILILLLSLIRDGVGKRAMLVSGILAALSPAMVYYSRYYIQETLLIFFTLGMIACGWRYVVSRGSLWACLTGLFAGMMFVTKETCVIAYASAGAAVVIAGVMSRATVATGRIDGRQLLRHAVIAIATAIIVWITFFSAFFTHANGPLDSLLAFSGYLGRASDNAHAHPWDFYLRMLVWTRYGRGPVWSEGIVVLLAIWGLVVALSGRNKEGDKLFLRFAAVYTVLVTVIYSAISYKTPWCVLTMLQGMILMAGVGAADAFRRIQSAVARVAYVLLLAVAASNLAWQAWNASYNHYTDPNCPYVYVQTGKDFMKLVKRVDDVVALAPKGQEALIAVVAPRDRMWPMPWYLRRFPMTGYWENAKDLPQGIDPAIMIMSPDQEAALDPGFSQRYHSEYYGLRPDVLLSLLIRQELWDSFIATQTKRPK